MYVDSYFHKGRVRRMDSGNGKTVMNVDGDRLSNLPDDLIHKILALIDTKHAVSTSTLSSRWRYIWTSMRDLNFSSKHFYTWVKFFELVKGVLSCRNNQIELSSVKLTLLGRVVSKEFVERILNIILNYAESHNVRQMSIAYRCKDFIINPSTWDLLALTTLNLEYVRLSDDKFAGLFSNFVNLKNLTLSYCRMGRPCNLNICHPGLSNLTLENGSDRVTVVTPQLKNLIVRNWKKIHVTCAPDLAYLQCEGHYYPLQLPAELLHLEKVDISIFRPSDVYVYSPDHHPSDDYGKADKIVCLLQQLQSVRFLTLNLEIIEILCSSVELISRQPSPFANLKSLKILSKSNPVYFTQKEETQPKVTLCTEVKNYLLNDSPGATFTTVSNEDIRALKKPKLAQKLITALQLSS